MPLDLVRDAIFWFGFVAIALYLLINIGYLAVHVAGFVSLRESKARQRWRPAYEPFSSPFLPGVGVIVPAYNEAPVIAESVRSLLTLEYPDTEIVVVNDGSTDETLTRLQEAFELTPIRGEFPLEHPGEPIRDVYRSAQYDRLLVVDKENGGKADALNAGIWATDQELFCAVDADTILDQRALLEVVRPFLEYPRRVVASGGTIRVANACEIEHGQVVEPRIPGNHLVGLQIMEYLRAFYSGRIGLDQLNSLVLISGAFGVFRTDLVREIGGYREDTITEDLDLVVRLHRKLVDDGREYRIRFVPYPVAWTEVPADRHVLSRQRRRWYRGLLETLGEHRRMIANPRYGPVGLFGLPFFTLAEALGPLVEGLGYVLIPMAIALGILNVEVFVLFLIVTMGAGMLFSWFGVLSEVWTFRRYDSLRDVNRLLAYGLLENLGYRQWKAFVAWHGLIEYLRGNQSWGVMERSGFREDEPAE